MIDANDIPSSQLILYADDGYDSHVVRLLLEEKKLAYYLSRLHSERPEDRSDRAQPLSYLACPATA